MLDLCEKVENELLFFLEEEESSLKTAWIREHLENCPRCAERARSMTVLSNWLRTLPKKESGLDAFDSGVTARLLFRMPRKSLPSGFEEKLRRAIEEEEKGTPLGLGPERRSGVLRFFQAAAAASVLFAAGMLGFRAVESAPTRGPVVRVSVARSLYFHPFGTASRTDTPSFPSGRMMMNDPGEGRDRTFGGEGGR